MAVPARANGGVERWDPFRELERTASELRRYIDTGFGSLVPGLADMFTPLADVEETDDAYVAEIELPGVKKDDIAVEVAGRRVTVSGERREAERKGILRSRTRSVGRFHYEVTLPGELDAEHVEASLADGVLTLRVPKATAERPRRIEVR
ncbi:MAG TPA: Hsp20/alpha crystallin family protein [Acidimicrobiia bacterium]|nr:Hsp20/alpha crystallin family protein [Acidimicrobiia bacterium]